MASYAVRYSMYVKVDAEDEDAAVDKSEKVLESMTAEEVVAELEYDEIFEE